MNRNDAHYLSPAEASATAFIGPTLSGLLPILGGLALGLATMLLLALYGQDSEIIIRTGLCCPLLGMVFSGLTYLGLFRALAWLADWWANRPVTVSADTDQDGQTSPEEAAQAAQLFTEEGLVAFIREHIYRRGDWRWRTLTKVLTQDEYDLIINDILVEVGVLVAGKGRTKTRALAAGADGQPLGQAEAERRIRAYFGQAHRRVWTIDVDGRRVIL